MEGANRIETSKRKLINIDIEAKASDWRPTSSKEELAYELALTLQDREGLPFYISCTNKYSEALLRGVLHKVMIVPDRKIKKSRGALYNHLIQVNSCRSNTISPPSPQDVHDSA